MVRCKFFRKSISQYANLLFPRVLNLCDRVRTARYRRRLPKYRRLSSYISTQITQYKQTAVSCPLLKGYTGSSIGVTELTMMVIDRWRRLSRILTTPDSIGGKPSL